MTLDKKLKKYASHIENPKYYQKINDILLEAFEKDYQFESFSYEDLAYIHNEIDSFFDTLKTKEERDRMIKYCNSIWFIISDKKYILWETESIFIALSFIIRAYFMIFFVKLSQLINPATAFETHNINRDMYLCRGGIKAAEFLNCELDKVEDYWID